ncbi:MAG: cytochrome P450 [Deltaproteobacteria bacterium]|nr:cytochrome P450 [Deltaproteobacteria bacterium]
MTRPQLTIPEIVSDPLAALGRARGQGWLADAEEGTVVALTHERVRELLGDERLRANFPEFLRRLGITSGTFYDWMAISPLNRDGAEHVRWRTLMSKTFTPRSVERLRPFLKTAAHELIDGFATRGSCDFVAEFADAYPSLGLSELIGVPQEDRDRFRAWANTIGLGFSPLLLVGRIGEVDAALTELLAYTTELAARRLAEPQDDLVTRIAQAGRDAGWMPPEVSGAIAGFVFAGHETTKNQLGWTVAVLSEQPAVWDAVASGALAAADVVEEVLRHRSTATSVGRQASTTIELGGETIAEGTTVICSRWSANHDPAAFPDPDVLDTGRRRGEPHFAFGHGAHFCIGAALARAELQEGLAALASRLTVPKVGPDAAWTPPLGITGPTRLPITFAIR